MGACWFLFWVVAIAELASSQKTEPVQIPSAGSWLRWLLTSSVYQCPGRSPKGWRVCVVWLENAGEKITNIQTVLEEDAEKFPSGCSIEGTRAYFNPWESSFSGSNFQVACKLNLKKDALALLNKLNEKRQKGLDTLCASAMLSTSASKLSTKETKLPEAPVRRARLEGYKTADVEKPVVEFVTTQPNFEAAMEYWLEDDAVKKALNTPAYKDIGFAWFPGPTDGSGSTDDFYVLDFGSPHKTISTDLRDCGKR